MDEEYKKNLDKLYELIDLMNENGEDDTKTKEALNLLGKLVQDEEIKRKLATIDYDDSDEYYEIMDAAIKDISIYIKKYSFLEMYKFSSATQSTKMLLEEKVFSEEELVQAIDEGLVIHEDDLPMIWDFLSENMKQKQLPDLLKRLNGFNLEDYYDFEKAYKIWKILDDDLRYENRDFYLKLFENNFSKNKNNESLDRFNPREEDLIFLQDYRLKKYVLNTLANNVSKGEKEEELFLIYLKELNEDKSNMFFIQGEFVNLFATFAHNSKNYVSSLNTLFSIVGDKFIDTNFDRIENVINNLDLSESEKMKYYFKVLEGLDFREYKSPIEKEIINKCLGNIGQIYGEEYKKNPENAEKIFTELEAYIESAKDLTRDYNYSNNYEIARNNVSSIKNNTKLKILCENGKIDKQQFRTLLLNISNVDMINQGIELLNKENSIDENDKVSILKDLLLSKNVEFLNQNVGLIEKIITDISKNPKVNEEEKDKNVAEIYEHVLNNYVNFSLKHIKNRESIYSSVKNNKYLSDKNKSMLFKTFCKEIDGTSVQKMLEFNEETDYYKDLVYFIYGRNVDFDEKGHVFIIPEIKAILMSEYARYDKKEFAYIVQRQYEIQRIIYLKKAKNTVKDGLDISINKKEIDNAVVSLNRAKPKSISALEFESIPGSEIVGQDSQYTSSLSTAVQRAHSLAEKMDKLGPTKKIGDFSVSDEKSGITLKVLHPQDKKAILMGYDAGCCFRPNGNADNSAQNEYSLLQYATTTPYGGVIECGKLDEDGKFTEKPYMASPYLLNGNMMMIHSYESSNKKNKEIVGKLLVKAAAKAIEDSRGKSNLKCVMMTNLHGPISQDKMVSLEKRFTPYFEGEYVKYKEMYTNLNDAGIDHLVLAAEVDGKILTGKELTDFFVKECNGSPKIFSEKVGLREGQIDYDYEYEKRASRETIEINSKTSSLFIKKYDEKKEERDILALANRRQFLLKAFSKVDVDQRARYKKELEELKFIENSLENYDLKNGTTIKDLNEIEINKMLKDNYEEMTKLYRGEDIFLLANGLGLTEEKLEKLVEERIEKKISKQGIDDKKLPKETGSQKKMRGALIGEIKRRKLGKEYLDKINSGSLDEKDLRKLREEGVPDEVLKGYESAYSGNPYRDEEKIRENRLASKKELLKKKYLSNEGRSLEKLIIQDYLKPNINDDMINKRVNQKTILTIKNMLDKFGATNNVGNVEEFEHNNMVHIEEILGEICLGKVSEKSREIIDSMRKDYGIDIEKIYKGKDDKNQIREELELEYFSKLKSQVTIDFETRDRISTITTSINPNARNASFEKVDYGISWYIAQSRSDGEFECFIDDNASEEDKKIFKEMLERRIEEEKNGDSKLLESMQEAYIERYGEKDVMKDVKKIALEIAPGDRGKMKGNLGREKKNQEDLDRH